MSPRRARLRPPSAASVASTDDETPRVVYAADVAATPQDVRSARLGLRTVLAEVGLPVRVCNAALDVAHELLLNAVEHGRPPIRLVVEVGQVGESVVLVQVRDGSSEPARGLPYRPGVSDRGLGLRLVRQLAAEWGQEVGTTDKTVWARIR